MGTFTITAPSTSRTSCQLLVCVWKGTDAGELVNSGTVHLAGGAAWPGTGPQYNTLVLIGIDSHWYELARSANS